MNYGDIASNMLDDEDSGEVKTLSYEELTKLDEEDLIKYVSSFHVDGEFKPNTCAFEEFVFGHYNPNILFDRANVTKNEIKHFIRYLKSFGYNIQEIELDESDYVTYGDNNIIIINDDGDVKQYNCDSYEHLVECGWEIDTPCVNYKLCILFLNNNVKLAIGDRSKSDFYIMSLINSYVRCTMIRDIGEIRYRLINILINRREIAKYICHSDIIILPSWCFMGDGNKIRIGAKFKDTHDYEKIYDTNYYLDDTIIFSNRRIIVPRRDRLQDLSLYFDLPLGGRNGYGSLFIFGFNDIYELRDLFEATDKYARDDIINLMCDIYKNYYTTKNEKM